MIAVIIAAVVAVIVGLAVGRFKGRNAGWMVGFLAAVAVFLLMMFCLLFTSNMSHVAGSFYVGYIEDPAETLLFRCPDGPNDGCEGMEPPGAAVFAARGNDQYVAVARHPRTGDLIRATDSSVTEYYYFHRITDERRGWRMHPEKIVGPLTREQFQHEKSKLRLPDL